MGQIRNAYEMINIWIEKWCEGVTEMNWLSIGCNGGLFVHMVVSFKFHESREFHNQLYAYYLPKKTPAPWSK
jgi:hypothetical protein